MLMTRLMRSRTDDRGSALMAVIALTGITAVIAVSVGAVTVSGLQNTNRTAATVEARAAADAGIAVAELALRTETGCSATGGVFESAVSPAYRVTTQFDTGTGWQDGCPPADATQVRFLAEGFPDRPMFGANADSFSRSLEAVYQYIPEYVEIPQVDPAIYAYTIEGVLKKFVLNSADNSIAADLQIKTGNFECSNNARVSGDVVLGDGWADLTACTITGTLHTTQYALVQGGSRINGDAIASGNGVGASADTVLVAAGTQIDGNIYAGGNVRVLSSSASGVTGNVVAARDTSTNVQIANGSTVSGNVLSSGTISNTGTVAGTRSTGVVGLTIPPNPQVPDWVDIGWNGSIAGTTWADQGFTLGATWTGDCNFGGTSATWFSLATYTSPTVIDATGCNGGVSTRNNLNNLLGLNTDIVIFADSFFFERLRIDSGLLGLGPQRKIYFIVPDNTPNALPTCSGDAGDITQTNEADLRPKISAFFYTPCRIYSDRNGFRGQLYGGEVEFGQQAQLTFVPTSPPGIDFSASLPPQLELVGAFLGERLSIREIASGG